jgi:hypothetical protein
MHASLIALARTVHLVDIENLAGTGRLTESIVGRTRAAYGNEMHVASNDQVIIGVSHQNNLFAVWYGWPGARVLLRSGPDGADHALQDVMTGEGLEHRFANCVLASGDGGFDYAVASLGARGLGVRVVCQTGTLSSRLRLAASAALEFDFLGTSATWSAV